MTCSSYSIAEETTCIKGHLDTLNPLPRRQAASGVFFRRNESAKLLNTRCSA